jgi:hypothetical protein
MPNSKKLEFGANGLNACIVSLFRNAANQQVADSVVTSHIVSKGFFLFCRRGRHFIPTFDTEGYIF